jgi:hypothetical protein
MANASLSQIEWLVMPNICDWSDEQKLQLNGKVLKVSAEVSFWIDANKLPAGLEVGDKFPSPDQLKDLQQMLIDEFNPESGIRDTYSNLREGIYNTNSVDSNVAGTAFSILSAFFTSFGFILTPLVLMFFGALILCIVLRKAVS